MFSFAYRELSCVPSSLLFSHLSPMSTSRYTSHTKVPYIHLDSFIPSFPALVVAYRRDCFPLSEILIMTSHSLYIFCSGFISIGR